MWEFHNEQSCGRKLKEYREAQGIVCPHCGCKEYYWKGDKKSFECKKCYYRQSLKSNTVMHGSQLVIEPKQVGNILSWVHIAISNVVYHDITPDYLQNYLNEFCYKFNRRYFGDRLFARLMVAVLVNKNDFRYNIA